jgi:hypothetical protein
MRTPREILLSRHVPTNPRLDAIREQVLAAECGQAVGSDQTAGRVRIAPWHARFWPSPWAWAGLAAAWVLTLTLHILVSSNANRMEMARTSKIPSAAIQMALAEQRLLIGTLTQKPSPQEPPQPRDPVRQSPRSERRSREQAV